MGFAIIIEKHTDGRLNYRSNAPLTEDLQEKAKSLDIYLQSRVPEIIKELRYNGLLKPKGTKKGSKDGSVVLWHSLGLKLKEICVDAEITKRRERRWLWEALENVYPTDLIRRVSRGKGRIHFEYCYRLARFRIDLAKQLHWSEWVTFFDSKTVREEERIDDWLIALMEKGTAVSRATFRLFVQNLNKRIKKIDTSELSTEELYNIYNTEWKKAVKQIADTEQ